MSQGAQPINEIWNQPAFLMLERQRRDFILFCMTARKATSPPGLISYLQDKPLLKLAQQAGFIIPTELQHLGSELQWIHSEEEGVFYIPLVYYGKVLRIFNRADVNYWKKQFDVIPDCPAKTAWRSDLLKILPQFLQPMRFKIIEIFADEKDPITAAEDSPEAKAGQDAAVVLRYFSSTFEAKGFGSYVGNWAIEFRITREILKAINIKDACSRIDQFFEDDWITKHSNLNMQSFQRNINKFNASTSKISNGESYDAYWDILNKQGISE